MKRYVGFSLIIFLTKNWTLNGFWLYLWEKRQCWKAQKTFLSRTMWPYFAKFNHFGIFLKSSAIFWGFIYLVFSKVLNPIMAKISIRQILMVLNGQILKNDVAIWSHWSRFISSFLKVVLSKCQCICHSLIVIRIEARIPEAFFETIYTLWLVMGQPRYLTKLISGYLLRNFFNSVERVQQLNKKDRVKLHWSHLGSNPSDIKKCFS